MDKQYKTIKTASKAAIALNINSSEEYEQRYQEDSQLPAAPYIVYVKKWVGWNDFLGKTKNFYVTIEEASTAVIKLKIKTKDEYQQRYKEDPRLPSRPYVQYADNWGGWTVFFGGTTKYATIHEASDAAFKLGISSQSDYKNRYKENKYLPSNPSQMYSDWDDNGAWKGFLKKIKYVTLEEASKVAIALNIKSALEYKKRYKEDPRLPANPNQVYEGFKGYISFLGLEKKDYYSTLKEASAAAVAIKIKSQREYFQRYKEDSRLHSTPTQRYKSQWEGWTSFLGGEVREPIYQTLEEATIAAIALNIKNSHDYKSRYKNDPRLPANPCQQYYNWNCWSDYLGGTGKYKTLKEASLAAAALKIHNSTDYRARYKEDARLPYNPVTRYKDWNGWNSFLGIKDCLYENISEASFAAIALKINSRTEYNCRYKEDVRLPSSPDEKYADVWVDFGKWDGFLGRQKYALDSLPEKHESWKQLAINFIHKARNIPLKERVLTAFLYEFIIKYQYPEKPESFLSTNTKINDSQYESFLNYFGEPNKNPLHTIVVDFIDFLLKELCYEEDEENGGFEYLTGYKNHLKQFESELFHIETIKLTESCKPPLAFSYVCEARQWIIPKAAHDFSDLTHLHTASDADWFDVDATLIDSSDPDCVFRQITRDVKQENGKFKKTEIVQIWSPIRFMALYTLLNVPLRGQQVLWLDSGEADNQIPVIDGNGKVEWVSNESYLVKFNGNKIDEGFLKKYPDDEVGMFITTNKTSFREGGYSVPWIHENLTLWVIKLRNWQAKYNPLKSSTKWTEIDLTRKVNERILKQRGANCFLFRAFNSVSPYKTTLFRHMLAYTLHKIERPENKLTRVLNDNDTLTSYESMYTPHSMRVSLITAYVNDGDVPIQIVSKLAGHARIVMTIYYTKVNHAQAKYALNIAEKKALEKSPLRIQQQMLNNEIEEAKSELVGNSPSFLKGLNSSWPNSSYMFTDIGICPMGGAKCEEGGEAIEERKNPNHSKYAPVPAGYLGERNCIRCRFFITGSAFLGGLMAIANEISLEGNLAYEKYDKVRIDVEVLDEEKFECDNEDKNFTKQFELNKKRSEEEMLAKNYNMYSNDFYAINRLINQSTALLNEKLKSNGESTGTALIANTDVNEFASVVEESSEFHQLSEICENAEIYTLANPSRAVTRRTQLIDSMALANGLPAAMFNLSEEQQLVVGNQMTQLLLDRFKSWDRVDQIINKNILLDDLSEYDQLVDIKKDVMSILNNNSPALKHKNQNEIGRLE